MHDFGGSSVHVVQIGLGTNGTFCHTDCSWVNLLLGASSRGPGEPLRGIGVDPVDECLKPLETFAQALGEVSLVLAAVDYSSGSRALFGLPKHARRMVHTQMRKDSAARWVWAKVDNQLDYLENMSSIDAPHPDFQRCIEQIAWLSGVTTPLLEERTVQCFTFEMLLKMHHASSCEVLIIDAEGADCAILQSMIDSCRRKRVAWPRLIHFETRGLADVKESKGTEEELVTVLQRDCDYRLVWANGDSTLLHGPALRGDQWLAEWADKNFTLVCYVCGWTELPSHPDFTRRTGTGFSQWTGTSHDRKTSFEMGRWCCEWCVTLGSDSWSSNQQRWTRNTWR
mmetsp:Transcript_60137/g.160022  ORF Transcript_60137/g.160022 Transcript_60137/m.160022 type:complete len:340 (-) Transcript_60137:135-1154(-)